MGFRENMDTTATVESRNFLQALVEEQQETNRLLRKLAGEPQPEHAVSDRSRAAKRERKTR